MMAAQTCSDGASLRAHLPNLKNCGCVGVRTCSLCVSVSDLVTQDGWTPSKTVVVLCAACGAPFIHAPDAQSPVSGEGEFEIHADPPWMCVACTSGAELPQTEGGGHTEASPLGRLRRVIGEVQLGDLRRLVATETARRPSDRLAPQTTGQGDGVPRVAGPNASHSDDCTGECRSSSDRSRSIPAAGDLGVSLFTDVITPEEEEELMRAMDASNQWGLSQSGRLKIDFGPQVNFKKKKVKSKQFSGFPPYATGLLARLFPQALPKTDDSRHQHTDGQNSAATTHAAKDEENSEKEEGKKGEDDHQHAAAHIAALRKALDGFLPVELCCLDYDSARGAHIVPHHDDEWIWGERLTTVTLSNDCRLTCVPNNDSSINIVIPLPRRSVIVVAGFARFGCLHGIRREHVRGRRVAMTFREPHKQFLPGGPDYESVGVDMLRRAGDWGGGHAVNAPLSPNTSVPRSSAHV
eukprot:GHVU01032725.1.p1 GENE.GHVU01032725.1~~GHVU01032725.1.p1  ORF type:complete len:465 (+),score=49.93 GHVU01032725.1:1656-3050(+)